MGEWKRCPKCHGKVEVLTVLGRSGKVRVTENEKSEAWMCRTPECGHLEVIPKAVVPKAVTSARR